MSLTVLVLSYAIIKLNHLVTHHNPNISTFPTDRVYDESTPFDLTASTLRPAFSFNRWDKNKETGDWSPVVLDDSRYVKLVVQTRLTFGHPYQHKRRQIPHHKCTAEEVADYGPLHSRQKNFDTLVLTDSFYCIDWDDEDPILLYGKVNNN